MTNGMVYKLRTRTTWCDLPERYGRLENGLRVPRTGLGRFSPTPPRRRRRNAAEDDDQAVCLRQAHEHHLSEIQPGPAVLRPPQRPSFPEMDSYD